MLFSPRKRLALENSNPNGQLPVHQKFPRWLLVVITLPIALVLSAALSVRFVWQFKYKAKQTYAKNNLMHLAHLERVFRDAHGTFTGPDQADPHKPGRIG